MIKFRRGNLQNYGNTVCADAEMLENTTATIVVLTAMATPVTSLSSYMQERKRGHPLGDPHNGTSLLPLKRSLVYVL